MESHLLEDELRDYSSICTLYAVRVMHCALAVEVHPFSIPIITHYKK